jgi:hypothetical protein
MQREMNRLMAKAHRSRIQSWMEKIHRASGGKIPMWMIQYGYYHPAHIGHIFEIRMPITDNWEKVFIPDKHYHSDCMPMEVQKKIDYWTRMRDLLEHSRDYAPMSGDLSPITPEEKSLFGVRTMDPNPCLPGFSFYGIDRGVAKSFTTERFKSSLY